MTGLLQQIPDGAEGINPRSRGAMSPELLHIRRITLEVEGAGNAGCTLHPRSRVPKMCIKAHTSIQGSGNTPTSPAQWLYGLYRALPGGAGLLSPSPPRSLLLGNLAPASRRQDHTTSPYASVHSSALARLNKSVHHIPRPTCRDDHDTPLLWARDKRGFNSDLQKWK